MSCSRVPDDIADAQSPSSAFFYHNGSSTPTEWADPTPYNVSAQEPKATHLTILLGANDNSNGGRVNGTRSVLPCLREPSKRLTSPRSSPSLRTSCSVPAADFQKNYLSFLAELRGTFPDIPIFILNSWGWPSADSPPSPWFQDVYSAVVDQL